MCPFVCSVLHNYGCANPLGDNLRAGLGNDSQHTYRLTRNVRSEMALWFPSLLYRRRGQVISN